MARPVALSALRSRTLRYANQRSTAFLGADEVRDIINDALAELYDLLVETRGHEYYARNIPLTTAAGSAVVPAPQDFFEAITLFANWGAQQLEELDSLDHLGDQIDLRNYSTWAQHSPKAWRLTAGNLFELFPTPTSVTNLELRYVPIFQPLVAEGQTFDGVNGWEKMACAKAAMEILGLQNLPAGNAEKIYLIDRQRIEGLALDRAAANPPTIRDVRFGSGSNRWWRRLPWPVSG